MQRFTVVYIDEDLDETYTAVLTAPEADAVKEKLQRYIAKHDDDIDDDSLDDVHINIIAIYAGDHPNLASPNEDLPEHKIIPD